MQITKPNAAVRIVLPYAVFAASWIYLSDNVLAMFVEDPALLTKIQTYKGLVFIAVTAALLYWLLRREFAQRMLIETEQETLRRRTAEQIQESEAFLRMAQHLARIGTWEQNLETKQFRASDKLFEIFGIRPEEFDGTEQLVWSFIHPDDVPLMQVREQDSLDGRDLQPVEFRIVLRDGSVRHLWSRRSMFPQQEGMPRRAFGVVLDITDLKLAEQALVAQKELLNVFVEHSPAAIAMLDSEMRYVAVSRRWMSDYGIRDLDLIGRSHYEVFPEIPQHWRDIHSRCLAGATEKREEDPFVRADGHTDWVRWEICPWRKSNDEIGGIVIFSEVITQRKQAEEKLRESEARFRAMVEASPIGIFLIDPDGNVVYGNPADLRMTGLTWEDTMGLKWIKAIHPDDREKVMADWRQAMESGAPYAGTGRYLHEDGTVVWWDVKTASVHVGEKLIGHVGMVVDITERVRAEDILRRWELIFQHAGWGIALFDSELNRLVAVNPAFAQMHGYSVKEMEGMDFTTTLAPEAREVFADATRRVHESGHHVYEVTRLRKDGSRLTSLADVTAIRDAEGKVVYRAANVQDITERKQVQKQLQEYADRLAVLSRQLLAAQETERRHIARELHDEIGQLLTVVKINLQAVEQQPHTKKLAPILKEGIEGVERILSRVRDLSLALRPSVLDDLGLVPALRWFTSRQAQSVGIKMSFIANGVERRFAAEIETACFRIAQEALTNVMRHAQATEVMVELGENDGLLEIAVKDNGVGFDAAVINRRSQRGKTFGLLGMGERAALAGGSLHIDSRPGSGTTVLARIPVSERDEN